MEFSKHGARKISYGVILDYILTYSLSYAHENLNSPYPRCGGSITGFVRDSSVNPVQEGDLVLINFANAGKWRLSWLHKITRSPDGFDVYRCESLIDGELCDWSNVSIAFFHRRTVNDYPQWKWSDAQHEFSNRWFEAARKQDEYMWRPCLPEFNEDGLVTIGVRMRHGMDDTPRPKITLTKWEAMTTRMLQNRYKALENAAESEWKARGKNPLP